MQTATNEKTGEKLVLVGDKWQKLEASATNDKGEKAYLVGGKWISDQGEVNLPPTSKPISIGGVVAEGAKGLVRGASDIGKMARDAALSATPLGAIAPVRNLITQGSDYLAAPSRRMVEARPENKVEQFAGTAGEIAGAGIVSGGAGSLRAGVVTGASALAGAAGEQMAGEVGQAVGAILPAVVDVALSRGRGIPKNMLAKNVREKVSTPYAQRGEEISRKTGIEFSLGQQTGDEGVMMVEGVGRKNPFSSGEFQRFGAKQVNQSVTRLQQIMDDITPEKVNDITIGQRVNHAFDTAVDSALKARRAQARLDFGKVDVAAKNANIVNTRNLTSTLDDLIKSYNVPGGGDATATLVKRLQSLRKAISTKTGLSASETERLLEVYTKASSGKGQIFADLETGQQRMLAGQLKTALLNDLDEAAATTQGGAASLLKAARDNYRANSASITKLEESVIGKFLGADRSPERVADFLRRAKPTELKQSLDLVNKADPAVLPATRRYFIEKAIEDAVLPPSQRNPSAPSFSAAKFIDAMPEGAKFEVLFGSSASRGDIKMVGEALERIAYRGFTEGSPTAPLLMAWDAAKRVFTIQGLAGLPAAVIAPKTVAKAALTPEGQRALMTMARYDKSNQSVIRAAAYLSAMQKQEEQERK